MNRSTIFAAAHTAAKNAIVRNTAKKNLAGGKFYDAALTYQACLGKELKALYQAARELKALLALPSAADTALAAANTRESWVREISCDQALYYVASSWEYARLAPSSGSVAAALQAEHNYLRVVELSPLAHPAIVPSQRFN